MLKEHDNSKTVRFPQEFSKVYVLLRARYSPKVLFRVANVAIL
jgi:hypothetical protein